MHFTQPDDIIQNVYDPQVLNRYAYVRNNPLRYTDPSGHFFSALLNLINTFNNIRSVVSNAKPSTPPTSSATLPKNIPNTPVNLTSQSNSGSLSNSSHSNSGESSSARQTFYVTSETVKRNGQIASTLQILPVGPRAAVFAALVMPYGPWDYKNTFIYGPDAGKNENMITTLYVI
jgi:hypothetical protein